MTVLPLRRIPEDVRRAFLEKWLPAWTSKAACASDADPDAWMRDEVMSPPQDAPDSDVILTETMLLLMRKCWNCPVRQECLEYAYDSERHVKDEATLKPQWAEDDRRYGLYGAVPGVMRERYAARPDRLTALAEWVAGVASERRNQGAEGWDEPAKVERRTA